MLVALTLGLMGSLGHCVGMCGPIVALLSRHPSLDNSKVGWLLLHAGRISVYALLGLLAGAFGQAAGLAIPALHQLQGLLALLVAQVSLYFALSILGWMPSPEKFLAGWIERWGKAMRKAAGSAPAKKPSWLGPYGLGALWGLLPCGLVLAALFTAAVSGEFIKGALNMLAFGIGTLPALLGVRWLVARRWTAAWPRYAVALVVSLFGLQFAMRGLAAWGLVGHVMARGVMLW